MKKSNICRLPTEAKIEYAGILTHKGKLHQQDYIMNPTGICRCLSVGSHLNMAWMHLIIEYEYNRADKLRDKGKK